jgi:hypothetical protein
VQYERPVWLTAALTLLFWVAVFSPFAVSRDDIDRHLWLAMLLLPSFSRRTPTQKSGGEKTNKQHPLSQHRQSQTLIVCFQRRSLALFRA